MVLKEMFFLPEEAADAFTGAAFFTATAFTGAAFFGAALFTARVAERDVVARSTETGAKAVAPAKRDARTASFMVVMVGVGDKRYIVQWWWIGSGRRQKASVCCVWGLDLVQVTTDVITKASSI